MLVYVHDGLFVSSAEFVAEKSGRGAALERAIAVDIGHRMSGSAVDEQLHRDSFVMKWMYHGMATWMPAWISWVGA